MILHNGDCLEFMRTLPDNSIDCVITDPPYGTTACKWDNVIPFEAMWVELKRIVKDNGAIVLFGKEPFSSLLRCSNLKMFKYDWIWDKKLPVGHLVSKYKPLQRTEKIHVFSDSACSFTKQGTHMNYFPIMQKREIKRKHITSICKSILVNNHNMDTDYTREDYLYRFPTDILEFSNANRLGRLHPTQKPVALLEYLVKTYTLKNETVLDFTMGSGSTGVACINTNRKFIGCELDKEYFDIAQKRIESIL